jgi:hypothetical protein
MGRLSNQTRCPYCDKPITNLKKHFSWCKSTAVQTSAANTNVFKKSPSVPSVIKYHLTFQGSKNTTLVLLLQHDVIINMGQVVLPPLHVRSTRTS